MERGEALPGGYSGGRERGSNEESNGMKGTRHRMDGRVKTRDGRGGGGMRLGNHRGVDRLSLPSGKQ